MRNSMLYNHLEALESNRKKGNKNLNIFEVGPIYNTRILKRIFYLASPQD
jgi:phenylalanyl-tRNA synthetase beta subunit